MTASELSAAFDDEPALVSYITAGDPSARSTSAYVEALVEGGSDIVELGLPFSEPIADGPTIQAAIQRSLSGGMTPDEYLDLVDALDVETPLVCMTYYNLIYQYGTDIDHATDETEDPVDPFVEAAAAAGLSGLIVPDLPVEESGPLRRACDRYGLDLVFIVAPTTADERLERILESSSGFVYVQARLGTTGARTDVSDETYRSLGRLPATDLPRAVGFGVSAGDQAEAIVAAGADGVVAGSVFVDIVATEDGDRERVGDQLRETASELKRGALRARVASEGERP